MFTKVRSHLTYANVAATLALFLALTGGIAWALERDTVRSKHIVDEQVKGADVDEGSLHAPKLGIVGRSTTGSCSADGGPQDCATLVLDLPARARVLVNANAAFGVSNFDNDGTQVVDDTDLVRGRCYVTIDGVDDPVTGTVQIATEKRTAPGATAWTGQIGEGGGISSTAVTRRLPAGPHTFAHRCIEDDGDVDFRNQTLSAVALGAE